MDFEDGGFDFAAVGILERHRQLEDAAGLQGADGIFAFLAAIALIDDEQLVLQGVRLKVIQRLRREATKIMHFFRRHQIGHAFHQITFSAAALSAEDS